MIITMPYEMTQELELGLGKERAQKFITFFEKLSENVEEKANGLAIQKKLEIKDELSKELASKADLALTQSILKSDIKLVDTNLKAEIKQFEARLNSRMDQLDASLRAEMKFSETKLTMRMNFLVILMILLIASMNPVVTKLISNWLKLGL